MPAISVTSYQDAVAVFCASRSGNEPAFTHAAQSLGIAIAKSGKGLIYGGGSNGIMGAVSRAALEAGARVTGITPYAMLKDNVPSEKVEHVMQTCIQHSNGWLYANGSTNGPVNPNGSQETDWVIIQEQDNELVKTIVVHSMHDRKSEMAKHARGFFGLPGGFGTLEEILEIITWSQIGLHEKPVVLLNVLGFYNPLRELIQSGIRTGFIQPRHEQLMIFVDGPPDLSAHDTFDWGTLALHAMDIWEKPRLDCAYEWTKKLEVLPGTDIVPNAS